MGIYLNSGVSLWRSSAAAYWGNEKLQIPQSKNPFGHDVIFPFVSSRGKNSRVNERAPLTRWFLPPTFPPHPLPHLASLVPIGKRFSAQICLLCIQDSREYRFLLVSFWYLQNYLTNRTALRTFPGKSTYLDDTEARLCSQLVISHTSI